jgi:sulfatase maturation enzyme AslB (radical SAM superfamily)
MFSGTPNSICGRCYYEQEVGGTSRRHKCNQKSVIFTKTNFSDSYQQSPGYDKFESSKDNNGDYDGMPIDLHIDLGNYCNLACKMCHPQASSTIASQEVKWGNQDAKQYVGTDWTRDNTVWTRVLAELANTKELNNIHFMGGETLLTPRFEEFVDYMLAHGRTDLNFSFVSNGTSFNESLIKKLKKFKRVGIEVSIETVTEHNSYQRQGTDTSVVLQNIKQYLAHCDGSNITMTARPAISALTIGNYHTLLRYCLDNKIIVKSLNVTRPVFLDPLILPLSVRSQYIDNYKNLIQEYNLTNVDCAVDYNESDVNQLPRIILSEINQCLYLLTKDQMSNSDQHLKDMVAWCRRWDNVYGYDARTLYPELIDILDLHGY